MHMPQQRSLKHKRVAGLVPVLSVTFVLIAIVPMCGQSTPDQESSEVLLARANQGNAVAQLRLGVRFADGKNYGAAAHWYQLAAEQGLAAAQFNLGTLYFQGQGVPKDYVTALHWYQLAANQGLAAAQFNLGIFYEEGDGVPRDYAAALHWYQLAANQGMPDAELGLASMYEDGKGVKQDSAESLRWINLAANQGHSRAQFALGTLYAEGEEGVAQDYVQAHMWMDLAASKSTGDDKQEIAGALDVLEAKMTPTQILTAQLQAREWALKEETQAKANPKSGEVLPTSAPPTTASAPPIQPQAAIPAPPERRNPRINVDPGTVGWLVFAVVVLIVIIVRSRRLSAKPKKLGRDRDGYQKAQTGVPHVGFRVTEKGFEVALKNKRSRHDGCFSLLSSRPNNRITVTREVIIINGKRLRPSEFRQFSQIDMIFEQAKVPDHHVAYTYGGETVKLPGVWDGVEAEEIVLAMNLRLREFWSAQQGPSEAEDLRNKRQTDF